VPTEVTSWKEEDNPLAWPPPDTATLFVTDVSPLLFTVALILIAAADAEAPIAVVEVQVTTWPAGLQFQPEPDALTYVKFASSVSVTVIVPVEAAFPELVTVME